MSDYRRSYVPGGMFFLTIATYSRRCILTTDAGRRFLRKAVETVVETRPFSIFATVLMPDHWHLVMEVPPGHADFSTRIKRIKEEFTWSWLAAGLPEAPVTDAQAKQGARGIWQSRYWEHVVQDEYDLERCTDYIHWNPRKHRVANRVRDWRWSSFHRFVKSGDYDMDWGGTEPKCIGSRDKWGEP